MAAPEWTVGEIAEKLSGICEGDASRIIRGVAGVREAGEHDLTFLANPKYAGLAQKTNAGAILVGRDVSLAARAALIRVDNPDRAFAQAVELFIQRPAAPPPGVHPSAVIGADVRLGKQVSIGACCVVESGAVIGDRTVLHPLVHVGQGAQIGREGLLYPHVSIREFVRIGDRVILHNGAVIGSDGFGYSVNKEGVRTKIPQVGIVVIGDDVEIGAHTTVDRARFGKTVIGNGVKIDNLVQIAHNVVIGDHAVIVAQVGISGSTVIGPKVIMAGQSGATGHLEIGAGAVVLARAAVTKDVPPGMKVRGFPAQPADKAARLQAHLSRVPKMREKLAELERRIQKLEG